MKVLLTGSGGQLAATLRQSAPPEAEIIPRDRLQLDVRDAASVSQAIRKLGPDLIINAAAYTAVDRAEDEATEAHAVNAGGAGNLARVAAETGARLIHISTDFVFDGRASTPYPPDAPTQPVNVYGASKLAGERQVAAALGGRGVILRTAWLYGPAPHRNFVQNMLARMVAGQSLRVVADQVGTPTATMTLAAAIWAAAARPELGGIFHCTDAGVASWYDLAVAVQDEALSAGLLTAPVSIAPVATRDMPTRARRPSFSVLDKTASWAALGLAPRHWRTVLRDYFRAAIHG